MWLSDFYVFQADSRESLTILYLMHLLVKHSSITVFSRFHLCNHKNCSSSALQLCCNPLFKNFCVILLDNKITHCAYRKEKCTSVTLQGSTREAKMHNRYRGGCRDHAIFPVQSCVNTDKLWVLQLTTVSAPWTAPLHSSVLSKSNHTDQLNKASSGRRQVDASPATASKNPVGDHSAQRRVKLSYLLEEPPRWSPGDRWQVRVQV